MSAEAAASAKGDPLRQRLASIEPASRGQDPSPARSRIRGAFDAVAAARKRGVTWAQITGLLAAEGIKAADGEPLTVDEVRALFHAERQLRLSRQDRRTRSKAPPPASLAEPPQSSLPSVPLPPPAAKPPTPSPAAPATDSANPYAEVERRAAEAKRRREQVEAAKEWNPYATKEEPE